jgi:RimJ/RimL family protein N-acetyltransferase
MSVPNSYYNQESIRLSYRALRKDDIQSWIPFFNNNPALRFVGMESSMFKHLSCEEKATKWIERQMQRKDEGQYGQVAVIEKATGNFIGVGGIIYRDEHGVIDSYEVTYSLLPAFHGMGYGTELAIHFKKYILKELPNATVISIIHRENEASINVARKNGMVPLRTIDNYMEMPITVFGLK